MGYCLKDGAQNQDEFRANLLDYALKYRDQGLSIIPILRGTKKPALRRWERYQTAPPIERHAVNWFNDPEYDIGGLAVVLGCVSGDGAALVCRDFDVAEAYLCWKGDHPDLAATLPTVRTHRGFHVYFRAAEERFHRLLDGEYRGSHRQYVVLPPSLHPDGHLYEWLVPLPVDIASLPILDGKDLICLKTSILDYQTVASLTRSEDGHSSSPDRAAGLQLSYVTGEINGVANSQYKIKLAPSFKPVLTVAEAIALTLPTGAGQRHFQIFEFARYLKSMAMDWDKDQLRRAVTQWHASALPFIRTKEFEDTWEDFCSGWERINHPKGAAAIIDAIAYCVQNWFNANDFDQREGYLLRLELACERLSEIHDGRPFHLSTRIAGHLIGKSHRCANYVIKTLVAAGTLKIVREGVITGDVVRQKTGARIVKYMGVKMSDVGRSA